MGEAPTALRDAGMKGRMPGRRIDALLARVGLSADAGEPDAGGRTPAPARTDIVVATWPKSSPWAVGTAAAGLVGGNGGAHGSTPRAN